MSWTIVRHKFTHIASAVALATLAASMVACNDSDNDSSASTNTPTDGWPTAALSASAAAKVDTSQFLPSSLMREWHIDLDARGVRATGSPAHEAYTQELYNRLKKAGVQDLHFEETTINQWSPTSWSLGVNSGTTQYQTVNSAYIPYSGATPAEGVTAELEYLTPDVLQKLGTAVATKDQAAIQQLLISLAPTFNGKVVLVDLPVPSLTAGFYFDRALSVYDPDNKITPDTPYKRTFVGLDAIIAVIEGLQHIGAKGIVFAANDAGKAELAQIYAPYHGVVYNLPGVYVDRTVGVKLRTEAALNHTVQLKLAATVKPVTSKNLIGTIPGNSDELVVLNSHTDGTNGVEDNGPDAIVNMAQYLTRLPKTSLDRSIMIMLSSGHFYAGSGIRSFLNDHKTDGVLDRIAAVMTVEHLGINEWVPNDQGVLAPTGLKEPGALFMPNQTALVNIAKDWAQNAKADPTFILPPTNPTGTGAGNDAVWPGEGQYFWGIGGIPTINYITGPAHLLNYGINTVDFVDFDLLNRETAAFTQMALDLTRVPRSELPRRASATSAQ